MIFDTIKNIKIYTDSFEGRTIGITSGCFDLLHPLHILYFNKCKRECDILIVQVDSDQLTFRNKNKIPHINELDRAYMIDNVKSVTGVIVINNLQDIWDLLSTIDKDKNKVKMFKNSHSIYGKPTLTMDNVELVIIEDVERFNSTTEITNHLKKSDVKSNSL